MFLTQDPMEELILQLNEINEGNLTVVLRKRFSFFLIFYSPSPLWLAVLRQTGMKHSLNGMLLQLIPQKSRKIFPERP